MEDQRYSPPRASLYAGDATVTPVSPAVEPIPIGGWLFLVALGLLVSPIKITYVLLETYGPIFSEGSWRPLTDPASDFYHVLWGPFLAFEILGNLLTLALCLVTMVLFFRRSKKAPKLAIAWYALGPAFLVADELFGSLIPDIAADPSFSNSKEIFRSLLVACIWIPYFLFSKRVKRTFTR